ncbi:MAG TPA: FAD-binding oxidoreductase [Flavipsychrobacter sp.]|nr:FAD-binding oxidoreductase [Flavipsychrobacter sp.]
MAVVHTLKILDTEYINYNVKRFVLEKPIGWMYVPGQATHIAVDLPGWEDKWRPFTFTSLNDWNYLELIIKIYDDHHSVTQQLGKLNAGSSLLMKDVFGTITYRGPGIFIAGGAGITPFIAIFRALYHSNNMRNVGLIYSNHYHEDVILHEELSKMLGNGYANVFTKQGVIGFAEKRIDRKFLVNTIRDFDSRFYLCGPQTFVEDISRLLVDLGAKVESIVI